MQVLVRLLSTFPVPGLTPIQTNKVSNQEWDSHGMFSEMHVRFSLVKAQNAADIISVWE